MIVTTVRVLVPRENHREMAQTVRSLLRSIRRQKGYLGSNLYLDLGEDEAFCLMGEWETEEDLKNHLRSEDFAILYGAINLLKKTSEIEFRVLRPMAGYEAVEAARGNI
jgi:quinol monooxygenase YgiN